MGDSGDSSDCGNYYTPMAEPKVDNIHSDYHEQWLIRFNKERQERLGRLDSGDWNFPFGD